MNYVIFKFSTLKFNSSVTQKASNKTVQRTHNKFLHSAVIAKPANRDRLISMEPAGWNIALMISFSRNATIYLPGIRRF